VEGILGLRGQAREGSPAGESGAVANERVRSATFEPLDVAKQSGVPLAPNRVEDFAHDRLCLGEISFAAIAELSEALLERRRPMGASEEARHARLSF
jgi:hypothetical protein